jgi:hypothetical protein
MTSKVRFFLINFHLIILQFVSFSRINPVQFTGTTNNFLLFNVNPSGVKKSKIIIENQGLIVKIKTFDNVFLTKKILYYYV